MGVQEFYGNPNRILGPGVAFGRGLIKPIIERSKGNGTGGFDSKVVLWLFCTSTGCNEKEDEEEC
jgi:hypothetical protein